MGNARKSFVVTSIFAATLSIGCSRPLPPEPPPAPPAPMADTPEVVIVDSLPTVDRPEAQEVTDASEAQPEEAPAEEPDEGAEEPDEGTKDPFNSETVDANREGKHILKRALMDPKRDP